MASPSLSPPAPPYTALIFAVPRTPCRYLLNIFAILAIVVAATFAVNYLLRCISRSRSRSHRASTAGAAPRSAPPHRAPVPGEAPLPLPRSRPAPARRASPRPLASEYDDCCICQSALLPSDDGLLRMPRCTHTFHADCINKWVGTSATCPLCRGAIPPLQPTSGVAAVARTINNP